MIKLKNKKELILNKGVFLILVILSIILHLSKINTVYSQNSSEKYYRHVIVDSRNEIKGIYPIDETLAKNIHSYRFIYNEKNVLIKLENLNIDCTKPFPVRDYVNNYISHDDWYEIKIEYIDKIEKRLYVNEKGEIFAYEIIEKDELLKNMSQSNYFSDGFLQNKYNWKMDDDGKKISEQFLDYQVGIEDYESTCKYNENGYKIEQRFYNENGQLEIHDYKGYAIIQSDYDEYGNEIERKYYGDNLKLIPQEYGFTSIQFDYDKDGNMIERRYYGINNELKGYKNRNGAGGGYAIIRYKYDDKGNILEISFYDTNYKLKEEESGAFYSGIAIYSYKYDMNCNRTEERFYGADGKLKEPIEFLIRKNSGYAIIKYEYDKLGNNIEVSYFGTDEKLNLRNFGEYAIVRYKYNELGKEVERSYYDENEKLINR